MLDLITFAGPLEVRERSSASITVSFRDQAALATIVPTNVYYRLDDETGLVLLDWTNKAPPLAAVVLAITAEQNRNVTPARGIERKTLSVMADRGLATQFAASFEYVVRNLGWPS